MTETLTFKGQIGKVTPDGGSGVVRLEPAVEGNVYAVISPKTSGRVNLMNGVGKLAPGTPVKGTGIMGPEALLATSISRLEE